MRIENQRAYVLHRRAFGESSVVVELFTEHLGRVAAMAKGAKAMPKRGKDLLQAGVLYQLDLAGMGELPQLRRFEALSTAPLLQGDRLLSLIYVNELLISLLPKQDAHTELFLTYQTLLDQLASAPLVQLLRSFEMQLLTELGYAPELTRDANGLAIDHDRHYRYEEFTGFVAVDAAGRSSTYSGASLQLMAKGQFDGECSRASRRLTRELITHNLHGRELRSWGLLAELEAVRESAREH
jgi:DNA repair protein RecO (recombination protein O)